MMNQNFILAIVPLLIPSFFLVKLLDNPLRIFLGSVELITPNGIEDVDSATKIKAATIPIGSQLFAYLLLSILGFLATDRLVPNIQEYMLRKNISGKDLGKKGTATADKDIPEALGIVPGTIFLVCVIFCLVGYAALHPTKLLDVNSALLSICFMLFLGFSDDVLDWPWRYKLLLPSIGSLPLLCCYNGSTSIVVPIPLRTLFMMNGNLTFFGNLISNIVPLISIDQQANGSLIDLGFFYLLYMGLLAVFCTNAINIFAGINGIEVGQSFIIGCAILIHNCIEVLYFCDRDELLKENHVFSIMIMLSFVGVTIGLLKHNWYPATVFVGDTYCYFAGMTFAVVAILGHFSKTLLLFFIPQIINFIYSVPQLFKIVPCPRHRLPRFDPTASKLYPSTFKCKRSHHKWLQNIHKYILRYNIKEEQQQNDDDIMIELPNMTVLNLFLQIFGPMPEKSLCIALLSFQIICCAAAFLLRYHIAGFFFDD